MTWKCPICGYENSDDALFCIQCGTKKPEVQATESQQEVKNEQQLGQPEQPAIEAEQGSAQVSENNPVQVEEPNQPIESPQNSEQPVQGSLQQTQPENSPVQSSSQVQIEKPSEANVSGGKYYIQFIATSASALNKMKVPLDFEVFENISVGRSPENVIVIPDAEVSRRHAIISLENGNLFIEDLNSTNGTYVYDGKMFQPVKGKTQIQQNSIIKLGNNTIIKIVRE
jgi:pSer/pThr/pTyr-binding forkhead associated (FHA) protein